MSIAELIMTGTNRASDSTAWVGDSLAKLGQNVGQALAQREQQKQAKEMLPFLQQSMQESMTLAGQGKTGEAYSKLMPFLTDPSVARNPFMIPALEAGIKMNQIAADDFMRQSQIEAYKTRYSGGGTGDGVTGADLAQEAIGLPAANQEQPLTAIDVTGTENLTEGVTGLPKGATMGFGMNRPAPTQFSLKDQEGLIAPVDQQAATSDEQARIAEAEFAKMPTHKQASVANVGGYNALSPQQKAQAVNQSVTFDPGASKYEETKIDLGDYGIDIGSIGVPKVNEQVRIKMTTSGTNADPTVRKTFSQEFIKVGEEQYKDNREFISKVKDSSSKLSRERPSADLPTFKEIFKQNGGILNATLAPAPQDELGVKSNYPFVLIPKQGATPIPITEKQYEMIQTIQTVPAIADSTGLNLSASKNFQKQEATAQPQMSREEQIKQATQLLGGSAEKATAKTTQPQQLSLEERLSQKTSQATTTPARTVTPQQLAGISKSQEATKVSALRSEKTKLERSLYDVSRASGKSTLKRGLSANDPDVIAAKKRISEIDKELE